MVHLVFTAPPIDHAAAELGDTEWVTKDGEILLWSQMGLWHLMGAYKVLRDRVENGKDQIDAGWHVASYISGEQASYDIQNQLGHLEDRVAEALVLLADMKRYIEYRQSIGNVHGD